MIKFFYLLIVSFLFINFNLLGQRDNEKVSGEKEIVNQGDVKSKRTILDDSTYNVYGSKTTLFLEELNLIDENYEMRYIDTSIHNFETFSFLEKEKMQYQNLGNIGTALYNISDRRPKKFEITSGFESYTPYYEKYRNIKYYDTKSPFIDLNLIFGGLGRSMVDFSFSRNVNNNWNLGFDIHRISSDKQIGAIKSKGDRNVLSSAFDLYVYHNSDNKKYRFIVNFLKFNHKIFETGGILVDDKDLPIEYFQYQDFEIQLKDVENHSLYTNFHTYNEYLLESNIRLYHKFDFLSNNVEYVDQNLSQNIDFYDNILIDTINTLDTFNLKSFENSLGIKGKFSSVYYNIFFKRYDLKYSYFSSGINRKKSENILAINIKFNKNSFLINADASLKQNGNYNLNGTIKNKFFEGSYFSGLFNPTIIENYYYGNHFFWENNFKSKFYNQINAKFKFSNNHFDLYPEIKLSSINNYIYFNSNKLPEQHTNQLYYNDFTLSFNVNFLNSLFHFDNKFTFSTVSGKNAKNILRIPKYTYFGKLYYTDKWFDDKIPIELGANLYYRSSYFANAYSPEIQQFYIQNHFKLKNYFLSNIYFNMKIENLRIFLKMTHFNQFEKLDGYFITPYYPAQRRVLDFGVRWLFFN